MPIATMRVRDCPFPRPPFEPAQVAEKRFGSDDRPSRPVGALNAFGETFQQRCAQIELKPADALAHAQVAQCKIVLLSRTLDHELRARRHCPYPGKRDKIGHSHSIQERSLGGRAATHACLLIRAGRTRRVPTRVPSSAVVPFCCKTRLKQSMNRSPCSTRAR